MEPQVPNHYFIASMKLDREGITMRQYQNFERNFIISMSLMKKPLTIDKGNDVNLVSQAITRIYDLPGSNEDFFVMIDVYIYV